MYLKSKREKHGRSGNKWMKREEENKTGNRKKSRKKKKEGRTE